MVADEVVVTRHAGKTQFLELRICSQLIEERIPVDRGVRAIVVVDRKLQHS